MGVDVNMAQISGVGEVGMFLICVIARSDSYNEAVSNIG